MGTAGSIGNVLGAVLVVGALSHLTSSARDIIKPKKKKGGKK